MSSSIILLAHGSRREVANNVLPQLASMIQEDRSFGKVDSAFLQFTSPSLETALEEHIKEGVKNITVVPVFLFNGIHLKEDIPEILEKKKEKHPDVNILMAQPLGADSRIGDIIKDRIKETQRR